ncbi:MAG: cyclic nucleotide-binding domain-containing protein [Acidobacteriota bacterium]
MRERLLQSVPLFETLLDEELSLLAEQCSERRLGPGQHVFREGEPADGLYVIEQGAVTIVRDTVGQPVQKLARLGPGGFFGEMGLLDSGRRTDTAIASAQTTLLHVRKQDLVLLLQQRPLLAVKLRAAIIRRHGHNVASAVELSGRREVRTRIDAEVDLELPDGKLLPVRLENLSPGGACLRELPRDWRQGLSVRFSIRLPEDEPPLRVEGMVAWRSEDSGGIAFRHRDKRTGEEDVRRAIRLLLGK